jgi:uncharacterized membrane protein required for colicin V production
LVPEIFAFSGIFIIVFIAGKIIEYFLKDIIKGLNLKTFDKILGLFLGLSEGFALIALSVFLLKIQPFFDSAPLLEQSFLTRILLPLLARFHV